MKKLIILLFLCNYALGEVNINDLTGSWNAVSQTQNNGTITIEREHLQFNDNHTFSMTILVSVQKNDAFIKDLHIEGSGIWKHRDNTLVFLIKKVEVPFAKEIYLISQESLRNLANTFKSKYENEPILINSIKSLDQNSITMINEKLQETVYTRQ